MKTLALSTILALTSVGLAQENEQDGNTVTQVAPEAGTATEGGASPTEELNNENQGEAKPEKPYHPLPSRCLEAGDVALTFDDGPGAFTQPILDVLDAQGTKATFHVVSKLLNKENSMMLKQALQKGHNIGLRFDTSVTDVNIEEMTLETFRQKLIEESESIHYHLGVYPRFLRMPFQFRRLDVSFHDLVKEMGFVATGWTIDSQDYLEDLTTEELVDIAYEPILLVDEAMKQNATSVQEGFIVLHRDLFNITDVVDGGISLVKGAGEGRIQFVTLGECLNLDTVYKKDAIGTGFKPQEEDESEVAVEEETGAEETEVEENEVEETAGGAEEQPSAEQPTEGPAADGDITQNLTDGAEGKYGLMSSLMLVALAAIFA